MKGSMWWLDASALMTSVNRQLGDFLRQRRERLTPMQVGLSRTLRRCRTPGLRREEVAELAGISIDWYTRLEQGRESLPSKATAEALAKALLLSATDRSHLLNLATGDPGRIFKGKACRRIWSNWSKNCRCRPILSELASTFFAGIRQPAKCSGISPKFQRIKEIPFIRCLPLASYAKDIRIGNQTHGQCLRVFGLHTTFGPTRLNL